MFKSEIFNSTIRPIFTNSLVDLNYNVYVDSYKDGKKQTVDSLDLKELPYCESIMTLALMEVSFYKESLKIQSKSQKVEILKKRNKSKVESKKLSNEELLECKSLEIQIENKKKKLKMYQEFKTFLTSRLIHLEKDMLLSEMKEGFNNLL
jgi:hypothetical protein